MVNSLCCCCRRLAVTIAVLGAMVHVDVGAAPPASEKKPPATAVIRDGDALRRTQIRLLKELAENGYSLSDGQDIKRIPRPFSELRMNYYREASPDQAETFAAGPTSMVFQWKDGVLTPTVMKWGDPGDSLQGLLYDTLHIPVQQVQAPEALLMRPVEGDWVFRADVQHWPERALTQLEQILKKECQLDVKLEYRDVVKTVWVARGKYAFKPAPLKGQPERTGRGVTGSDLLEIYAEDDELAAGHTESGRGEFDALLEYIGLWSGALILDESETQPASGIVEWRRHYQISRVPGQPPPRKYDPAKVLARLGKQTGLTFTSEPRPIRTLCISLNQK